MKLAAYSDDPYFHADGRVGASQSFASFLARGVGPRVEAFTLLGRLDPEPRAAPVELPADLSFVALPWWVDQSRPAGLLRALPGTVRRFWRVLDDVDCVLLFGPSVLGLVLAVLTRLRGRRLVLGVRMNFVAYTRHRHPGRGKVLTIARALDRLWRALARRAPVVVVGSELARRYAAAPRVLDAAISLVPAADVADAGRRDPAEAAPVRVLTVSRLDTEKNPLLLADVLADLLADGSRWQIDVCGDGELRGPLSERARALGVADSLHLHGFVDPAGGLMKLYRDADMFLHVSWTEGVPQVLLEAWATGLPVVATDVGGVRAATGSHAGLLVPPGDAHAAAEALRRVREPETRAGLVAGGLDRARERTLERQADRVVAFLAGGQPEAAGR